MARGFASFVMFFAAGKVLLVREFKNYRKPGPPRVIWWKTPGGRHDEREFPNETPVECAIRRFYGETGIRLTPDELKEFRVVPCEKNGVVHDKYFYAVRRDIMPELPPYGDRFNEIGAHTPGGVASFVEDDEVHLEHREVLADFLREVQK